MSLSRWRLRVCQPAMLLIWELERPITSSCWNSGKGEAQRGSDDNRGEQEPQTVRRSPRLENSGIRQSDEIRPVLRPSNVGTSGTLQGAESQELVGFSQ